MQHVHTSGPPGGKDEAEGQGAKAPKIKKTKVVPLQVAAAKAAAAKYKLMASEAIDRATDVFGRRVAPSHTPLIIVPCYVSGTYLFVFRRPKKKNKPPGLRQNFSGSWPK